MNKSFPVSLGLTAGAVAGFVHVVWSIMVASGVGQAWVNWVAYLHFATPPVQVGAFDLGTAVLLAVVTSVIGFLVGYVFGTIWVKVRKT